MASSKNIPMEINIEVLSQLPVKSLSRFKCVCKSWKNLIESPEFFKLHLNRSLKINSYNCSLILTISNTLNINGKPTVVPSLYRAYLDHNNINLSISKIVLPLSFQPSFPTTSRRQNDVTARHGKVVYGNIEVAGSCDGLVLILSGWHHIAVCNPAIEQEHGSFKILPCISYPQHHYLSIATEDHYQSYRVYDENQLYQPYAYHLRHYCFRVFGFGYDCYSHQYKIVYLTPLRALIYSLKKDGHSWRKIDLPDFGHNLNDSSGEEDEEKVYIKAYNHGAATNNHLHWNITKYDPEIFKYSREIILSFDLEKEVWGEVLVPDEIGQGHCLQGYEFKPYIIELGVLNGCLCLLISRGISHPHLELWIMKEYGVKESWTKLCNVPNGSGIPLAYRTERGEFLLPGDDHGLGWYRLQENKIRKIQFHGCEFTGENYYSTKVKMCIESFAHPFTSIGVQDA